MAKKKNKNPLIGAQAVPTTPDKTVKLDIDTNKKFTDLIIDAGISGQLNTTELDNFTNISNARDQIYQLIDTMMQDSTVSSIVRTYAEDVTEPSDDGHIVWCESKDPNISKFVNYLLNTINVDKNIYKWAYNLIEYGDVYLRLFRESDYKDPLFKKDNVDKALTARTALNEGMATNEAVYLNIHKANDPYSYYVEMVPDPGTMFELTRFGITCGYIETPNSDNKLDYLNSYLGTNTTAGSFNYKMKSNDVNIYQADDFVHACLDDNNSRRPETVNIFLNDNDFDNNQNPQEYTVKRGKSLLYDSYKVWREKSLLENSALLNRVTRSSVIRKVSVEVGDMPKSQVQNTLRRVKELFEQKSTIDVGNSMTEYTNPGPMINNVYVPTHNQQGAISVEAIGGDVDVKNIADIDYWNNRFYASYGIPKQYFGWCLKFDTPILLLDGSIHTIEELYNNKGNYIGKGIMGCSADGSLCPTKITNIMLTNPKAKYMRIWLDNGKYVDVTPDHKMMLRNGTFIPANDLVIGESLMSYYEAKLDNDLNRPGRLVIKIEYFNEEVTVYDITVESDCHTFALPCGIFVHNCEDAAGFNGGSSLTILSSIYAKGVKRVQNSLIQAITDIINLILINKGCTAYLNNFTIKMKVPATQEEKDFRESLSNKISAISNMQSLFSDIEDKGRKLGLLKTMISTLNYGDEITQIIDDEIKAAEEAAKKEAEEAAADSTEGEGQSENEEAGGSMGDIELPNFNESLAPENYAFAEDFELTEDTSENLPTPEELNSGFDFTKNE